MKPSLEVLICTCNDRILKVKEVLLEPRPDITYLVSHQIFPDGRPQSTEIICAELQRRSDVRIVATESKGLSKNRNNAIKHAQGKYILIADDDINLVAESLSKVIEFFDLGENVECCTFRIETPSGSPYKEYKRSPGFHNRISILSVSSIELVFRLSTIRREDVHFDERFGLGTSYPCSEEAIFLSDLLQRKIRVFRSSVVIVVHDSESSGQQFGSVDACRARGAFFHRAFGWYGYPLLLAHVCRKYPKFRDSMSFSNYLITSTKEFFQFGRSSNDTLI